MDSKLYYTVAVAVFSGMFLYQMSLIGVGSLFQLYCRYIEERRVSAEIRQILMEAGYSRKSEVQKGNWDA